MAGGFNPQTLNYRALSGNQVAVLIGDEPIAFAQTVTCTIDWGAQSLFGVGSANVQEVQQLRIQPSISITAFALTQYGESVAGQSGSIVSVLANNQFNFTIHDRNGNILLVFIGGVCGNFGENIPTNQTVTDTLSFMCVDVLDNSGQTILNVGNAIGVAPGSGGQTSGGSNLGVNVRSDGSVSIGGGFSAGGFSIGGGGTI